MTIEKTAQAFASGKPFKCHNATTNGTEYILHVTRIAYINANGNLVTNWGGYYTRTTASHLNAILKAFGSSRRVSYAQARKYGEKAVEHISVCGAFIRA
jgi:hypothetical protein